MAEAVLDRPAAPASFTMTRDERRTFVGLMAGMFVAAISQGIVGTAMPRIIAELGGMDHYSWVATAAMLASAIVTPIVGKLSDLYGRKSFYLGGLVVFMLGAVVSGLAPNFAILVLGRTIQGMGMGTLMPLSQTIIGDIVPPRQRGKYQGYMGAVFGVTTVAGPIVGGLITDAWGWRWLFFVALPIGVVTLLALWRFMNLPHTRREARIDYWGMTTLSLALVCVLLATSWGGSTYPWASAPVLGLYAVGAAATIAFVLIERRVPEPVIPLRLFRSSVFTLCLLSGFLLATLMFGAVIYLPVYAQGVLGVNATVSGLILMPLMVGQILVGIAAGWIITKTGRYKELMLLGVVLLGVGVVMLTQLTRASDPVEVTYAMLVFGIGLGAILQQYTLLVQNIATRKDLGVATASTQFFRTVGSTVGIAIWGTLMTGGLPQAIARHLPLGMNTDALGHVNAGSVLDPGTLSQLPPGVSDAVRRGLADQLHGVFLWWLPIVGLLFLTTLFIKEVPLRDTVHTPDEQRREYLDAMAQSSVSVGVEVEPLSEGRAHRTRERLLGLQFEMIMRNARRDDRPLLRRAVTNLGKGDFERGMVLMAKTAILLGSEDDDAAADAEKYAAEVADLARQRDAILDPALRADLAVAAAHADRDRVLQGREVSVAERHEAVEIDRLARAGSQLISAVLADISEAHREPDAR